MTTTEMTQTENELQDAPEAPEADTAADDTTESETEAQNETGADDDKPSGREARYRKRAQEAEAQRDALAATVERLQRGQLESAIAAAGVKPAAVFAVTELGDLLAEDGTPSDKKIAEAVKIARDQLGIPSRPPLRQTGMRSGAGYSPPKKDGWVDAFRRQDH